MIPKAQFDLLVTALGQQATDDIEWAENIEPPKNAEEFSSELIFVICNSGMKNTIARQIYDRIMVALHEGLSARTAFGHPGKSAAIDDLWQNRERHFASYCRSRDKLTFLGNLPWIGSITKYHAAKNFGVDVAKPDIHLQRLAAVHRTTPQALCEDLAAKTGLRVATVDTILWRACANGILNGHTGEIANA